MIEKDQKLSYMISLGYWEVMLSTEYKTISAVYIGKYKRNLLFETSKLFDKNELLEQFLEFKIFMPSFCISGNGSCVKIGEVVGKRDETIVRFMLAPETLRIKQQRHYKRLPILEKATLELSHQTVNAIVKDISLQGIGISTEERIRGEFGLLSFEKIDLQLNVQKVHEFTDFNLFQYGMKLSPDQSNYELKAYLLELQKKIRDRDFVL